VDFDFETFTHINRGKVDITGVFAYLQVQLAPTAWFGADATLLDISSISGPLRRRPESTGGINFTWRPTDAWSVYATLRYVGERLVTSIPTGDRIDGAYLIGDTTVRYRHSAGLALWLAIDNVFDTNWEDAPGFPAPGLGARLGAELTF
jgi:outer membrane cobalamin receptor